MTDTTLIWHALLIIIPDSHPAISIYVNRRGSIGREKAMMYILKSIESLFKDTYTISKLRVVGVDFLKMKEREYRKGNIKINTLY